MKSTSVNSCRSFAIPRHHIQLLKKANLTFPTKPQQASHPSPDHVSELLISDSKSSSPPHLKSIIFMKRSPARGSITPLAPRWHLAPWVPPFRTGSVYPTPSGTGAGWSLGVYPSLRFMSILHFATGHSSYK